MPTTNGIYTPPAWVNGQAPSITAAELLAWGNATQNAQLGEAPLINQWDESTELGGLNATNGLPIPSTTTLRGVNYIPCSPNTEYFFYFPSGKTMTVWFYTSAKAGISKTDITSANRLRTTPATAKYMRFVMNSAYGTTYGNDISVNYPSAYTDYYPAGLSKAMNGGGGGSGSGLPPVTAADNGKFLRVVDGVWAAASVPNAEEVYY